MQCPPYYILWGKEDIKKDCKFCQKTERKSLDAFNGYECEIKREKRKMKRCSWCYFGHSNFGH